MKKCEDIRHEKMENSPLRLPLTQGERRDARIVEDGE